jgi:hypothetical protein
MCSFFIVVPLHQAYKKKEAREKYFIDVEQDDLSIMDRDTVCQEVSKIHPVQSWPEIQIS